MERAILPPIRKTAAIPLAAGGLLLLPASLVFLGELPAWKQMWLVAFTMYACLKGLTWAACPLARSVSVRRSLAYLLLWPGMNARAFLNPDLRPARPAAVEWLLGTLHLAIGALVLAAILPRVSAEWILLRGWLGVAGLLLIAHFGLFRLLSVFWRSRGISAEPLMHAPWRSCSLSDFWGRRWNSAFRDLSFHFVLRPLASSVGVAWATMTVFLISGLIHELAISWPVRAGWGGPTLYFLLQGGGLLLERSKAGRQIGLSTGIAGRIACAAFVLLPAPLLFHEPFLRYSVLPTVAALTAR
ncbi:MAG TPA: membrane bound O-acyl transferase family-domain-containing protein [Pirellulales bacterium]|jgi:hypothetical protein|nr:membrane bound O-acyl transferase family-domain-containing protein [Pirellulales bacterium]